jgi:hypothetical protein
MVANLPPSSYMTNLSRIPDNARLAISFLDAPEEQETAAAVLLEILPTIQRKQQSNNDNLIMAGALFKIRAKHGYKSQIYQMFLTQFAALDENWEDKEFRRRWFDAYQGYECLPGTDQDRQCVMKLNPSRSALAAIRQIPDHRVYKFFTDVKKEKSFPTASGVEQFARRGKFTLSPTPVDQAVDGRQEEVLKPVQEDPIIDVESKPVVEPETPTTQELEQLESANTEADQPIDGGKFANISTTTTEDSTVLDELNTIFSAYEAVVKARRQEIKDNPKALAVAQCLSTFNLQWLNIEPSHLRR